MKRLLISSLVAGFVAVGVAANAEEAAPAAPAAAPAEKAVKAKKEKAPVPPAIDITVTGTLKKEEKSKVGKDGKEVKKTHYAVAQEDGTVVMLPAPRGKKDAAPVNYDAMVDKKVKVVGKGREVVDKKGAKKTVVSEVVSVEEIAQ